MKQLRCDANLSIFTQSVLRPNQSVSWYACLYVCPLRHQPEPRENQPALNSGDQWHVTCDTHTVTCGIFIFSIFLIHYLTFLVLVLISAHIEWFNENKRKDISAMVFHCLRVSQLSATVCQLSDTTCHYLTHYKHIPGSIWPHLIPEWPHMIPTKHHLTPSWHHLRASCHHLTALKLNLTPFWQDMTSSWHLLIPSCHPMTACLHHITPSCH